MPAVSPTATDFSVATPAPGAAGQAILDEGGRQLQGQQANTDAANANSYLDNTFTQRTMPQLQSTIGANGQWYSGARQNAEGFAGQDFAKSSADINSALNRQMIGLTQQRMYQSTGLIV